jgi:hypothetical protein
MHGARNGIPRRSGNRNTVHDVHDGAANLCAANSLNLYTSVSTFVPCVPSCEFIPAFDADGTLSGPIGMMSVKGV